MNPASLRGGTLRRIQHQVLQAITANCHVEPRGDLMREKAHIVRMAYFKKLQPLNTLLAFPDGLEILKGD